MVGWIDDNGFGSHDKVVSVREMMERRKHKVPGADIKVENPQPYIDDTFKIPEPEVKE